MCKYLLESATLQINHNVNRFSLLVVFFIVYNDYDSDPLAPNYTNRISWKNN